MLYCFVLFLDVSFLSAGFHVDILVFLLFTGPEVCNNTTTSKWSPEVVGTFPIKENYLDLFRFKVHIRDMRDKDLNACDGRMTG